MKSIAMKMACIFLIALFMAASGVYAQSDRQKDFSRRIDLTVREMCRWWLDDYIDRLHPMSSTIHEVFEIIAKNTDPSSPERKTQVAKLSEYIEKTKDQLYEDVKTFEREQEKREAGKDYVVISARTTAMMRQAIYGALLEEFLADMGKTKERYRRKLEVRLCN